MHKQKPLNYFLLLISFISYCLVAFQIERYETTPLVVSFVLLFLIYAWVLRSESESEISFWIFASILFRLCFLFSTPLLSDDFYRFIWDGRLLAAGVHPFAELPRYYIENNSTIPGIDKSLFNKLNSPDYFTIYPPVNQFIFWVAARLSFGSILSSVIVIRLFIIASEIGTIWLIKKILHHYQLPARNALLYALNPLVVIELTGNLHFEALLIFFLLLSYWLLIRGKLISSAISFSLAICTKLVPLIFLPLMFSRLGWKKSCIYYLIVGVSTILLFLPLLNAEIISGFNESIGYYFKKFEFNASIYYLVREWGFWKYGYNIIQTVGWKLAVYCTFSILVYSSWDYIQNSKLKTQKADFNLRHLPNSFLVILCIYFAFATIVHPWYVTTILAFSVFTTLRFPVIWTAMIFLTYVGYSKTGFSENLWITSIEYLVLIGYLVYELIWKKEKYSA
ncbi:MAG: polyprenol phosphomannose-dependent alpha 1,6 mannosyltransferase MptB [Cytophagales bacterium]|nr:polyprenol phosphomannose-dependent alpha 1,6 mannosyltransferase MptB [Cytophagales bacterium]MCA6365577.1 polyprenol phosphomannose-dependent alpha 1,6 mannosyltransferase MptB [Cytophagales bacterium]MCA6372520.1 polyprenol phosphomannose-dependent alpha 1,6 mannosyltransferase MptB [Cytophagales bacterium]MCA6374296.1 polyprenol phosphomannose-dependent alpha 1,6 mannosyltransferase MptB [Cytophagales bacterium]MCA6383201.1 polyprenol phosphomannose-dependent alpha 1,6 mannosyltransferas